MTLRKVLFWLHLAAGVVAGIVIAILCFTGAALAFETELVEWAERDARRVARPSEASQPLPLDDLIARARTAAGGAAVTGVTVASDPTTAVSVAFGRELTYFVNPYTGEARQPASTAMHDFMHVMVDWHRYLAQKGDDRPLGKAITGVSNSAFLFLAVSGLYLWWPRQWTRRALRPSLWFVSARGKARDWNWHNVVGFWSLPILIVLTASGMVISYRWASNLVYRTFGEEPPQQQGPGAFGGPAVSASTPPAGARPLPTAALFDAAKHAVPDWETVSLRLGGRGATGPGPTAGRSNEAQPVTLTVREHDRFPTFGSTTVTVDPLTGEVLDQTGFAALTPGRQARLWMRWLHVGQGFGWLGQLIAGLACVGGLVLVYTGFALAWRRLIPSRSRRAETSVTTNLQREVATATPPVRGE